MFLTLCIKEIDMPRNLDLTALRSFMAVADSGGVTRAAGFLNLTQSAVSMQLKRLEENLGAELLDRSGRTIALTTTGEQLLSYARRILALNDEVYARMMDDAFEGEVVLGVPHDIVYPAIPQVLQQFHAEYPRMQVNLVSSYTRRLKEMFDQGACHLILGTEDTVDAGGETLIELPLIWVGAPGGAAWRSRPLRLAFETNCVFRTSVQAALEQAGIAWEMAVNSDSTRTIEASVSADLAVHAVIEGACPAYLSPVPHGGALPDLQTKKINLYASQGASTPPVDALADMLRKAFSDGLGRDYHFAGRTAAA